MNYELAKELKDAGFPQKSRFKGGRVPVDQKAEIGTVGWRMADPKTDEWTYIPTLSELTEACGLNIALQKEEGKCIAQRYGEGKERVSAEGATLEEATTMLWLALNKKEA